MLHCDSFEVIGADIQGRSARVQFKIWGVGKGARGGNGSSKVRGRLYVSRQESSADR